MKFGNDRFGIECCIRKRNDSVLIADLWLWAEGWRIGDEVSGVDLPLLLAALSGPLFIGHRRHDAVFDSLSKEEVVELFVTLVFGEEAITSGVAQRVAQCRRYLLISAPDLEGFDTVFLLVLGTSGGADRLIWKYKEEQKVHELKLSPGEYDAIVLSCHEWVEQQTGYRSPERAWLDLREDQREELRRLVVIKNVELGLRQPEEWEHLDQAAIRLLEQRDVSWPAWSKNSAEGFAG